MSEIACFMACSDVWQIERSRDRRIAYKDDKQTGFALVSRHRKLYCTDREYGQMGLQFTFDFPWNHADHHHIALHSRDLLVGITTKDRRKG